MKKLLLLFFAVVLFNSYLFSQFSYTFSAVAGAYTANATPTTIHGASIDEAYSTIPIGFTFNYQCTNYTNVVVSSNGWLSFNTGITSANSSNNLATSTDRPMIAPLWDDLKTDATGSVNYKLTGSAPNRILTVEWKQMLWYWLATTQAISFQVKLYETTNVIEFIYTRNGNATQYISSASASIGISGTTSGQYYSLDGVGASPNASTTVETSNLSSKPATGQIYRWTPAASCSGTPSAGTITAPASVCSGVATDITLSGATTGCGISYQWQSSPTGGAPWTNVGTNSTTYSVNQTTSTYYQCTTTCSNSGLSATSPSVQITMSSPTSCYCSSTSTNTTSYFNAFSTTGGVTNITNNASGYSATGYGNFTAQSCSQAQGSSINFSTTLVGTTVGVNIWVDWNQDGDFSDAGETVYSTGAYVSTCSGSFTVPITATTGNTRMRIRMDYNNTNPAICGLISTGETEDYTFNVIAGTPMTYSSSTTTQTNTSNVGINTTSNQIIGVQIVTTGAISPIDATSFTFTTTGTTNAANDITNAKLWSTGTSNTFATTTQVGSVVATPNGTFTITGTVTLLTGTNYFWLTYDVPSAATLGNVVDATCSSLTVAGIARTPTVTSPAGNRPIAIVYCTNTNTINTIYYIDDFSTTGGTTNITNNNTGFSANGYGNYTAKIVTQQQGLSVNFSITETGGTMHFGIWVDWNQDGDFADVGEDVYVNNSTYQTTATGSFTVPVGATLGSTRMRVVGNESGTVTACTGTDYTECEDYTFTVTAGTPMAFASCTTTQTNTSVVGINTINNQVIGIQIVTTGAVSPIFASSFTFNTTGSTAPTTDIINAKLWTTGTSGTFATTTQVGSAVASPNGTFVIAGSVTLSPGTNYLWLTYDIPTNAVINNFVDAQCTSIEVSGAKSARIPTVTSPAGNRQIALVYCTNTNTTNTSYYINNFSTTGGTANITNNGSGFSANGYGNFTAQVVTQERGLSVNFSVTEVGGTMHFGIWVDWNHDGDFADVGEDVYVNNSGYLTTATGSFTVPVGATLGNTRMRVVGNELGTVDACTGTAYTECEDYTFNVTASTTPMSYVSCTTAQPNTSGVGQGGANKEIIRMEIVTSGMLSPISVTSFRIRTNGSTNPVNDGQNLKIWYTGTSSTFATTLQFGSTVAALPATGTNLDVAGSQALQAGTNYFWVSYDIKPTATIGNVVDAECTQIVVTGNKVPTVTAPAGSRPITAPTPTNDDPCGATVLAVNSGSCSYQQGDLITSTTASAGIPAPGCSSLGPDIWFVATVPASGQLIVNTESAGGPTDMGMAWYTSSTNNCNNIDNLIECDDDDAIDGAMPMICAAGSSCLIPGDCQQNPTLTPGTVVYIRMWEYGGGTYGAFNICAYDPGTPGASSNCSNAETIPSLPFSSSNTTCCKNNTYGTGIGCASLYQGGEDYLYKYTPPTNQTVDISLSGTLSYTGVFITDKCPDAAGVVCVASNTSTSGNPSLCGVNLSAGITYYIMIDTDPNPTCTPFNISISSSSLASACNMAYTVTTTAYSWETYFGTNIVLPIDDRFCDAYIPIGFPVCFDGYQYTGLLVSSNGYLIFDPISCTTNLPSTNAAPNTYSGWVIDAAIPNTTNAPRNAILGPWHDINPAVGGSITYGILGTAPNRRIVVTWANAPLYSSSCGQIINQQIKIFESTNNIEIHLKDKVYCTLWNGGAAIMGLHNYNGTSAVVPAGYNYPTTWTATNQAWKFTNNCATCINPLPIELTDFNGKNEGPINKLWWSTSSEINNEYFVIEKFVDGDFQEIGRVRGAGNSNTVMKYEFNDDMVINSTSYYKLKQVDYNGKFKYSDIISVNKLFTFKQNVYPNPAIDAINVLLGSDVEIVHVIVYNNLGKEMVNSTIKVNGASFILDVSDLQNGMYTIKVFDNFDNEILKDKIVINRK